MLRSFRNKSVGQREINKVHQSLDNFVVGPCNETALKAASLFTMPDFPEYYNPLLIIGANGSGKTHLLKGVYQRLCRCYPSLKIIYTTTANFTREYTRAIRHDNLNEFREKYKLLDVFLMDDIQFLSGKQATQQELGHLFDSLFNRGKKIMLTTTSVPSQIKGLNERLGSRLNAGLSIILGAPDYKTKRSILASLSLSCQIRPESALLDFIVGQVNTNLHDLLEVARQVFEHKILSMESGRDKIEKIIQAVLSNR